MYNAKVSFLLVSIKWRDEQTVRLVPLVHNTRSATRALNRKDVRGIATAPWDKCASSFSSFFTIQIRNAVMFNLLFSGSTTLAND